MQKNVNWISISFLSILLFGLQVAHTQNNYWSSNPTPAYVHQNQVPYENTNTNTQHSSTNFQQVQQRSVASFLKAEEQHMVDEINAVRTQPLAYTSNIETYIQTIEMDADFDPFYKKREIAAARELIQELRRTPSMSSLQVHRGLYNAAISHGNDIKRQGRLNHTGSNGSQIWDRLAQVNGIVGGAENLIAGAHSAKESVIILLVDGSTPSRGHRKNILNPKWEYVADYVIGDVGGMPNAWIQLFGDAGNNPIVATTTPTEFNNRGWQTHTNHQPTNTWRNNIPSDYGVEVTPNRQVFTNRGNPPNANTNINPSVNNTVSNVVPSYMKSQEKAMIDEINLLRSNPVAYIPYIEAYITRFQTSGWDAATVREEVSSANELIQELQNTLRLPTLQPYESLHQVAIKHGKDVQRQGRIGHVGSDGSWPWDRVKKMTDLSDGGENLVGGGDDVRESVIMLLVDSGIPSRGHRNALLDSKWEYVACYEIGMVGPQNDSWVQVFAKR